MTSESRRHGRRRSIGFLLASASVLVAAACSHSGPSESGSDTREPVTLAVDLSGQVPVIARVAAAEGATVVAKSLDGTTFSLAIPAGALLADTSISLTPVASATGPDGLTVIDGVDIQPDGLLLREPAVLTISDSSITEDTELVSWDGRATVGSPIAYAGPGSATFSLIHFSGYGTAQGVVEPRSPVGVDLLLAKVSESSRWSKGFPSMVEGRDLVGKNLDRYFVKLPDGTWDLEERPSGGEACSNYSAISTAMDFHHLRRLLGLDELPEVGEIIDNLGKRIIDDLDCLRKACEAGDTTVPVQFSRVERFAAAAGILSEPVARLPIEKCQPGVKVTLRAAVEVSMPSLPGWTESAIGEGYLGASRDGVSSGAFPMDVRIAGIEDVANVGAAMVGGGNCTTTPPGPGRMEAGFRFIEQSRSEIELRPYVSNYTLVCDTGTSTFTPVLFTISPLLPAVYWQGTSILVPIGGANDNVDWNWFDYSYDAHVTHTQGGVTARLTLYVSVSAEPGDPTTAPGPEGMVPGISNM